MIAPTSFLFAILLATPLVSAHGKIAVVTGDLGGNGTALGIKGAIVPGAGSNSKTETDTTTFNTGKNNCGETVVCIIQNFLSFFLTLFQAGGKNKAAAGTKAAMELSGSTLPQISVGNATLSGTYHIVTSDGAGPLTALVDTTGNGDFTNAVQATVTTQVPGKKGNIKKTKTDKRWAAWGDIFTRSELTKRATNINEDFVSR
jgi:hypothetical protein